MPHAIGKNHLEVLQSSLDEAAATADLSGVLMSAALIGQTPALQALLDKGAEVNATDPIGWTPLMEAIFAGHTDTALALLKRGADVNAADRSGWTALMEAASKGHAEAVRLLVCYGADTQAKSRNGWTALKVTPKGNLEILKILKQAGART